MKKLAGVIILLLSLLTGCKESAMEPVEINPEIDVCEICNMGISHENFASEVVTVGGEVYKFDDVGCMEEFIQANPSLSEQENAQSFVRDVVTGEWVRLEDAYHAYDPDFWTPMANGVVSFKNKESADAYILEQGKGERMNYKSFLKHEWSEGK